MRRSTTRVAILAIAPAILAIPRSAQAVDRHWNVGSGAWVTSSNWSPNGVPSGLDDAFIDFFANGAGGVARLTSQSVPAITSATVTNGASFNITTFGIGTGSILIGTNLVVGTSGGQGTLNLLSGVPIINSNIGGTTVVDSLRLGVLSGSGVANQNAGTVTIGNQLQIGDSTQAGSEFRGSGTYNLSGGTLRAPRIYVGYTGDSTGGFNLSGSGIVNANNLVVGRNVVGSGNKGKGIVNQSGGQMNVSDTFKLGEWSSVFPQFRNNGTYTLSGGSLIVDKTFIFPANTFRYTGGSFSPGELVVGDNGLGMDAVNGRVELSSGGGKLVAATSFVVHPGSVIDLNDNRLTALLNTTVQARLAIQRGYHAGAWDGDGITSTAARINPAHNTALGYALLGPLTVKYTYYGDTDLNGVVNFDDYARIDAGFNNGGTDWFHGDFNYDGVVNFDDYALIDLAFNRQGGALRAIPEPGPASLLSIGAMLIRRRAARGVKSSRAASHR